MATGLLALLDDVAAIAKVAASSLDDIGMQAAKSGVKAAGVVIDDAAVAPTYVTGFTADRELPIVWRITLGSIKNKLVFLLPGALLLDWAAPWAIMPILAAGGVYLCFEGTEKVLQAIGLGHHEDPTATEAAASVPAADLESQKISGAIRTDLILSAEIMAITLASIPAELPFIEKALVMAVVAIGITVIVYGAVAIIVKADDVGIALARRPSSAAKAFGGGIVKAMPYVLKLLSVVGTAAMVWVGGGIVVHALATFGVDAPEHLIHDASTAVGASLPAAGGLAAWLVSAAASGVIGLAVGAVVVGIVKLGSKLFGRKAH